MYWIGIIAKRKFSALVNGIHAIQVSIINIKQRKLNIARRGLRRNTVFYFNEKPSDSFAAFVCKNALFSNIAYLNHFYHRNET